MYNRLITNIKPLGFTWQTQNPFLFCVHHLDHYPKGNEELGPDVSLAGRNLGQDFTTKDEKGNNSKITLISGSIDDVAAPSPAPDSWAADAENDVSIWLIKMAPHASLALPTATTEANRSLYFYRGSGIKAAGIDIKPYHSIDLLADEKVILENGYDEAFMLLLQGKPIDEPVVQHGPFVMNNGAEIKQAIMDYQKNQFGGWPWPRPDNVHDRDSGRFAKYADGREEQP